MLNSNFIKRIIIPYILTIQHLYSICLDLESLFPEDKYNIDHTVDVAVLLQSCALDLSREQMYSYHAHLQILFEPLNESQVLLMNMWNHKTIVVD